MSANDLGQFLDQLDEASESFQKNLFVTKMIINFYGENNIPHSYIDSVMKSSEDFLIKVISNVRKAHVASGDVAL
jgi:hypothetical protein